MSDHSAPTHPPTIPAPLLPAAVARRLARMFTWLGWSCVLISILEVLQALFWVVDELTGYLMPIGIYYGCVLLSIALLLLSYGGIWQLIRSVRQQSDQVANQRAAKLIGIFYAALTLQAGLWMVGGVFMALSILGIDPESYLEPIPWRSISSLATIGFLIGARSIMLLMIALAERTAALTIARRMTILYSVWKYFLILILLTTMAHWPIDRAETLGKLTSEQADTFLMIIGYLRSTAIIPIIWSATLMVPFGHRLRRLAEENICPECKYDLRGDLKNGCPECGWGRSNGAAVEADNSGDISKSETNLG